MAQVIIDISTPNDGLGDPLRSAFNDVNTMFTELYTTKVDKVPGKGLSSNDFDNTAQTKLSGIADFAEVNVQSDVLQADNTQDDFIKNKDALGGGGTFIPFKPYRVDYVDSNTFTVPPYVVVDYVGFNDGGGTVGWTQVDDQLTFTQYPMQLGDWLIIGGVYANVPMGFGGANTFIELSDTPSAYTGQAGKVVKVNATADGLEFGVATGGGEPIVITANKTAVNGEVYHNIGNNTYTDPTGVTGKGYWVLNLSGIATIGGSAFSVGTYLFRYYDGTNWITNTIKKGVDNVAYSANRTITPQDNGDTIFMDSGTLTVNPSTQVYKNGHANAVMSSGIANTPLVLTAATDWTYVINGATAVASASVNIEKGYTCTIIRKSNLKIFFINGSII